MTISLSKANSADSAVILDNASLRSIPDYTNARVFRMGKDNYSPSNPLTIAVSEIKAAAARLEKDESTGEALVVLAGRVAIGGKLKGQNRYTKVLFEIPASMASQSVIDYAVECDQHDIWQSPSTFTFAGSGMAWSDLMFDGTLTIKVIGTVDSKLEDGTVVTTFLNEVEADVEGIEAVKPMMRQQSPAARQRITLRSGQVINTAQAQAQAPVEATPVAVAASAPAAFDPYSDIPF